MKKSLFDVNRGNLWLWWQNNKTSNLNLMQLEILNDWKRFFSPNVTNHYKFVCYWDSQISNFFLIHVHWLRESEKSLSFRDIKLYIINLFWLQQVSVIRNLKNFDSCRNQGDINRFKIYVSEEYYFYDLIFCIIYQ